MNFYNTIYQLITENDCVIIPNFGAFISRDFSATVNFTKQEFAPPRREVVFNSEIKHNDPLLANYIAAQKNISFAQASEIIEKYVIEINKILEAGESVSFNRIGSFSLQNQKLIFSENKNENIDENSYGLTNFVYPYLQQNISFAKINNIQHLEKRKKKNKIFWVPASIVAASLIGAFFLYKNFISIDNTNIDNHASIFPTEIITTTENTKEIEKTINLETEIINTEINENEIKEAIEETTEIVENKITEEIKIQTPKKAFIIAGAFSIYQNAVNLQKELKQKGYESEIFSEEGKLHRVSIKSYETKDEAIADLNNLETTSNYTGLWILFF